MPFAELQRCERNRAWHRLNPLEPDRINPDPPLPPLPQHNDATTMRGGSRVTSLLSP